MKEPLTKKSLSSLAPLLLFAVFTACILLVLLSGADIYRKIAQRDQHNMQNRTISQYLTTRLHQSDTDGMVSVGDFDTRDLQDGNTLYLRETINGRCYYTRIYAYDGMLRELFAAEGISFQPADGTGILPLKDLHFSLRGSLLTIGITYEDASEETIYLVLRSSKEEYK